MRSKQRLIVSLVSLVSVLAKYLTAFLIVASLIEGYILITSTDAIFISSFFNPIYSIVSVQEHRSLGGSIISRLDNVAFVGLIYKLLVFS